MLFWLLILGAVAVFAFIIYRESKGSSKVVPTPIQGADTQTDDSGKVVAVGVDPLTTTDSSFLPPRYFSQNDYLHAYSPLNVVKLQDSPTQVYYYDSSRVPDFLLPSDARQNLAQTRYLEGIFRPPVNSNITSNLNYEFYGNPN